jgi:glycosyltransferase involved in cell wall biosynthesis
LTNQLHVPKISVLIPVYNTGKYLPQCLESVLNQTFTDFEIIAVDDGSNDNSLSILQEFSRKDPRIRVYPNETNRGVSYSLNRALQYAAAPLIARVDSDDVMIKERFEKQYAYLQAHPECIVLGGQAIYINEQGELGGSSTFPLTDEKIKHSFFNFQAIADPTVMMNRARIPQEVFYFKEDLISSEGLDLYFRLMEYGKFANLSDVLILYRQRAGSLVSTDLKRTFRYIYRVRQAAIREYGIKPPFGAGMVTFLQKMVVAVFPFGMLVKLHELVKRIFIKYT